MAERILFNPEEVREEKNWRDFQPGDFLWLVPDPDENGTVDPDEIKLVVMVEQIGNVPPDYIDVIREWSPVGSARKTNLYLSVPKPE